MITKNRNREAPVFANINLLGTCNAKCFFCLGKDISEHLDKHNQLRTIFYDWKNFEKFLRTCEDNNIKKLYITGQNTDALLYWYLDELVDYLQEDRGFTVGLRTNGFLAKKHLDTINKCKNSCGYSVHTLSDWKQQEIMGTRFIPDWPYLLENTERPRVAIVVNRHNVNEFFDILWFLHEFPHIRYVQARRISTDTRYDQLKEDIEVYEQLFKKVQVHPNAKYLGDFYCAQQYDIFGLEVNFWRTVETSVNSFNYFTDGTISKEYFVVEGYLKNMEVA